MLKNLGAVLFVVLAVGPVEAKEVTLSGTPTIVDGDTLEIFGQPVRLYGVDAAESGQRCVSKARRFVRPGDMSEARLASFSAHGISCTGSSYDDYGRLLAVCTHDGVNINRQLVAEGLAWAFVKYSRVYAKEEAAAKTAGLGIWSMACEEPWTFRAKRWAVAQQKAPGGCAIKGNNSENGRIYHAPWRRHYTRTMIDTSKGERWFCDEAEAVKAGWRAAIR